MKHAMSTVALIAVVAILLMGADVNSQAESRRIVEDNFRALECSWDNSTKALERARILIDSIIEFDKAGKLDKADKMEDLTKFVEIVTSQKSEEMRCKFFMKWYDLVEAAAYGAGKSLAPPDVLLKWKFRLGRYAVMKADFAKYSVIPDSLNDGTYTRLSDEFEKDWGSRPRNGVLYREARHTNVFQKCMELNTRHYYGQALKNHLVEEENFYYDKYKCLLYRDYKKLPRAEGKALVKDAEAVLGRPPKWYPLVEDLTPEDAVERMGHDIECEFELARHEFGAFTKKLGAIPDMTRRAELIAKATEMVLVREPGRERLPNYNEIEVKVNWISSLAGLLQNDKRASTAWSFRLRLLMAMKRVLERYEAANVSVWTAEGPMSIPTMRAHDIVKLQSLHNGYKKSMNDTEWQGLDALKIQLRILSYENQYFDGDDCVLKMCLAKMTPEDRAETMKKVEAVLGRKPKWYSDETGNEK